MNVGEVRFDELRLELGRVFWTPIHEDDVDNVIPYVSLTFNLKIKLCENLPKSAALKIRLPMYHTWPAR